jgi:hypothetical protein
VAAKSETRKHTPDIISPAIWRAGLPSPIEGRSTTNVQTCVIHHSATSNTDTNYVNVLRNVYLLHTQSNGWDDIGYNFLIAGDGTVFRGRDVEANNENEHVVGAHFCGNNHHTSGICLLGNFNTASLSKNAEDALVRLLTWEHEDFDLEPSKSIVPHSSGCPTACPGEKLNTHLPIIQSKVAQQLEMKDNPMVEEFKNEVWSKVYPNPSTGRFFIMANKTLNNARAIIYNETKQVVHQQQLTKQGLVKASIPSGLYFLEVLLESGEVINTRIVIY